MADFRHRLINARSNEIPEHMIAAFRDDDNIQVFRKRHSRPDNHSNTQKQTPYFFHNQFLCLEAFEFII